MSKTDRTAETPSLARRGLLTGAGIAVASAAAVPLVSEEAEAFKATPDEKAPRYKDNAYVQRFYAFNRR